MNIDELIRESIDESTSGRAPSPDIAAMRRGGRRRSVGRAGGTALATLAVVAAGTYVVQGIDGSDELPVSIRDQGSAMAFVTGPPTRVHLNGKTFTPDHGSGGLEARAVIRTGLVYISGDSNGTPYFLDRSGEETRIGDAVNPDDIQTWSSEVVADPDRRGAAWSADVTGPEVRLNWFDADSATVTDTITFDPADIAGVSSSSSVWLTAVRDGVVYARVDVNGAGKEKTVAWDPSLPEGDQVYAATDPGTIVSAAGTGRILLKGRGDAYGGPGQRPLDPTVRISRLPGHNLDTGFGVESAMLSPDGQWALVDPDQVDDSGVSDEPDAATFDEPSLDLAALNLDTLKLVRFHSQGIWDVTFDDDGSVLMFEITPDRSVRVIDCTLPSEKCTTVLDDVPRGGFVD